MKLFIPYLRDIKFNSYLKDISIDSEFGKYSAKFTAKEDKLVYARTKMMVSKKYPPEKKIQQLFAAFL